MKKNDISLKRKGSLKNRIFSFPNLRIFKSTFSFPNLQIFKSSNLLIATLASLLIAFSSCTEDIHISVPSVPSQFVVEGHIQTGLPPYVILTKSSDFFATFYLDSIND